MSPRAAVLVAGVVLACAPRRPDRPAAPSPAAAGATPTEVRAVAREYLEAYFRWRPEDATTFGFPGADHAGVPLPVLREKFARWVADRRAGR